MYCRWHGWQTGSEAVGRGSGLPSGYCCRHGRTRTMERWLPQSPRPKPHDRTAIEDEEEPEDLVAGLQAVCEEIAVSDQTDRGSWHCALEACPCTVLLPA